MSSKFQMILLALALVILPGCCAGQVESRDALLEEIGDLLKDKVRPAMVKLHALDDSVPADVEEAGLMPIDEAIASIADIVHPEDEAPAGGGE